MTHLQELAIETGQKMARCTYRVWQKSLGNPKESNVNLESFLRHKDTVDHYAELYGIELEGEWWKE